MEHKLLNPRPYTCNPYGNSGPGVHNSEIFDYCVENRLNFDPMQRELSAEDSVPHNHRAHNNYARQEEHNISTNNYAPQERRPPSSYTNYDRRHTSSFVAPSNVLRNDGYPSHGYQQLDSVSSSITSRTQREDSVPAHQIGSRSGTSVDYKSPEISHSHSFQTNHRNETRYENRGYESRRYEGANYDTAGPSPYTRYR